MVIELNLKRHENDIKISLLLKSLRNTMEALLECVQLFSRFCLETPHNQVLQPPKPTYSLRFRLASTIHTRKLPKEPAHTA